MQAISLTLAGGGLGWSPSAPSLPSSRSQPAQPQGGGGCSWVWRSLSLEKGGCGQHGGADGAALGSAQHSGHATLHPWQLFPQWGPQEMALASKKTFFWKCLPVSMTDLPYPMPQFPLSDGDGLSEGFCTWFILLLQKRPAAPTPEPVAPVGTGCSGFPPLCNMNYSLSCFPPSGFADSLALCPGVASRMECRDTGLLSPVCLRGVDWALLGHPGDCPVPCAGWAASPWAGTSPAPRSAPSPQEDR